MRYALAIFVILVTGGLIYALSRPVSILPALGPLLNPNTGWICNARCGETKENRELKLKDLKAPVEVWFEDRQVPHIRAQNNHDLYYTQGYVTAFFRLWQMDLQTRAAAGRVSEVAGEKALAFDRGQRRKGMVYAAEKSLAAIEGEPRTREMLDAYRDGINAYIATLGIADYPLEYKLMGFSPEPWTNLRSALLLKYMADDLTGYTEDIPLTYLRDKLAPEEFDFLYPEKIKGSKPVIPEGTKWEKASMAIPAVPGIPDSLFAHFLEEKKVGLQKTHLQLPTSNLEQDGIGSNSWAISGQHTASGAPILCNDPHLGLNLPSLWFEVQLTAPGINTYGVSLPGAPGVVIGFNDSLSWGLTNNYRDVKDYYEISPSDADHYWFNGRKTAYIKRPEKIGVKGGADLSDTVLYTVHGPVQYDAKNFSSDSNGRMLAMTWMAHRGTNEMLALFQLNRAQSYNGFVEAISHFECPAQNFVYADRSGNIAMWGQGRFINKWKGQGRYVMEGKDSLTLWGQSIPSWENPHVLNPAQGYLVGANQSNTDSTYPYWYNGTFSEFRSWAINLLLNPSRRVPLAKGGDTIVFDKYTIGAGEKLDYRIVSPKTMMEMQNNRYSHLLFSIESLLSRDSIWRMAYMVVPEDLNSEDGYLEAHPAWRLDPSNKVATLFQIWVTNIYRNIWQDEFVAIPNAQFPSTERTMQIFLGDSTLHYFDDKTTSARETFRDIIKRSLKETTDSLEKLKDSIGLEWYKVKNTSLTHLAKIPAFSYTGLKTGGSGNTINAMKKNHGPSWRMIVQMGKDSIEAYGVYPGGQSGNPGSKHYSDFIDNWVEGKYFRLVFLPAGLKTNPFKITWTLRPA